MRSRPAFKSMSRTVPPPLGRVGVAAEGPRPALGRCSTSSRLVDPNHKSPGGAEGDSTQDVNDTSRVVGGEGSSPFRALPQHRAYRAS